MGAKQQLDLRNHTQCLYNWNFNSDLIIGLWILLSQVAATLKPNTAIKKTTSIKVPTSSNFQKGKIQSYNIDKRKHLKGRETKNWMNYKTKWKWKYFVRMVSSKVELSSSSSVCWSRGMIVSLKKVIIK